MGWDGVGLIRLFGFYLNDVRGVGGNGEQARVRVEQGFDMVSIATDVDVLVQGFAAHAAAALGDNGQDTGTSGGYSAK